MTWHIRLMQAREALGISKTRLGQLVGVSAQAVTQWESGHVVTLAADNLLAICDVLSVSPTWLVKGMGPTPPQLCPVGPAGQPLTSVGERIKPARQAADLSQDALAAKLGMSQSAVSQWELGTRTPEFDAIAPLARVLGVSLDWLLGAFDAPLADIRTSLLKRSALQVLSQLTDALASGRISEPRLGVLSALIDEFATPT